MRFHEEECIKKRMPRNVMQNPITPKFFLGVGAQKSGTSWLSNYFNSHPEILMSPLKEMVFFGNRERPNLNRFERMLAFQKVQTAFTGSPNNRQISVLEKRIAINGDVEKYKNFFQNLLKSEKAYGEITPRYAFLEKDEFIEVRDHFPACRIIFLMRNPVERAWSQMRFSHTNETVSQLQKNALSRMKLPAYFKRNDYKKAIKNITSVFPRGQIHFEFFENLFTQEAVNNICDFLGVTHKKPQPNRKRNVSPKINLPSDLRREMTDILKPQYQFVNGFFGSDVPAKWHDDYKTIS